ncbi:ECF transporter S component [Rathayibacter oskolensis]|uniref:ECF transporter S component n=1 Tax=Rathayibacter oskolensis TaxID=1891671 RepID=UPI00265D8CB8|nr:ECF transporter S component [Rathayibacter oskolensis]WKK73286.1 ECF transporter S component [Rathayibacter oskolensis]
MVFWAWGLATNVLGIAFDFLPGLGGILGGGWLFAGVLGGLIIRKPGAALFTELLAALVSGLIGTQWGFFVLLSGLVQGLRSRDRLRALPLPQRPSARRDAGGGRLRPRARDQRSDRLLRRGRRALRDRLRRLVDRLRSRARGSPAVVRGPLARRLRGARSLRVGREGRVVEGVGASGR